MYLKLNKFKTLSSLTSCIYLWLYLLTIMFNAISIQPTTQATELS